MTKIGHCRAFLLSSVTTLAACGSVEVPRERWFRLDPPAVAESAPTRGGVLRVQDLQLGTALEGDCLLVQDGVAVLQHPFTKHGQHHAAACPVQQLDTQRRFEPLDAF